MWYVCDVCVVCVCVFGVWCVCVFLFIGKLFTEDDIEHMMQVADKDSSGFLEYDEFIDIVTGVDI